MVRFCSLDYDNTVALAFRLMQRSGGALDALGAFRADCAPGVSLGGNDLLPPGLPPGFDAAHHLRLHHGDHVGSPAEFILLNAAPTRDREPKRNQANNSTDGGGGSSGGGGGSGDSGGGGGGSGSSAEDKAQKQQAKLGGLSADVSTIVVEPPPFSLADVR
jgi:uncharacterized membrane protein YgcG